MSIIYQTTIGKLQDKIAELERRLADTFKALKENCRRYGCEFKADSDGEGSPDQCNKENCTLLKGKA